MIVWRFRKGALVVCCSILLLFVFITFSAKHEERSDEKMYSKEHNKLLDEMGPILQDTSITEPSAKKLDNSRSLSTCIPTTSVMLDVAAVVCGDRLEEAMNMVKSILIFTKHQLHFHIVAEMELQDNLKRKFESFPLRVKGHFGYTIYNLSYPAHENPVTWKKLFKKCASQRLFLMNFVKKDRILYLDTDTLVVSPLEYLWEHFTKFNASHLAALAPEGEVASLNWYSRFARHPYYGKLGLNSGVMLMDLKKLREINFEEKIISIYREYKLRTVWGDQDLLNVFFYKYPELIHVYPCEWNYRPDHCMYENNCQTAVRNGVYVMHGSRGVFHNSKQPAFQLLYNIIRDYKFGEDIKSAIISRALHGSKDVSDRYCKQMIRSFVKNMQT